MSKTPRSSQPPSTQSGQWKREEAETGFTPILQRMLAAIPGGIGAALVDVDGEAVDYAGRRIEPFDLKVAAAQWRIVLLSIERGPYTERAGALVRVVIETEHRVFVLDSLPDGYALLCILRSSASLGQANRALDAALLELHTEAGWSWPPGRTPWYEVNVALEHNGRPNSLKLDAEWSPLRVIGRVAGGLQPGELGYRVELLSRAFELTLVRARDGLWYADTPPTSGRGDPSTR